MGKVVATQSVSLDGFSTGASPGPGNPLGDGGDRLHQWMYNLDSWRERHHLEGGESSTDAGIIQEAFANLGAVIMGRVMFDSAEEPWGDDPPFHVPVFVITHEGRDPVLKQGGTSFTFVNDGIEQALGLAQRAAGDREVSIAGGADTIQQYLAARLIDELQIDLVPTILGAGRRLFEHLPTDLRLEPIRVVESPAVTHVKYRVSR